MLEVESHFLLRLESEDDSKMRNTGVLVYLAAASRRTWWLWNHLHDVIGASGLPIWRHGPDVYVDIAAGITQCRNNHPHKLEIFPQEPVYSHS